MEDVLEEDWDEATEAFRLLLRDLAFCLLFLMGPFQKLKQFGLWHVTALLMDEILHQFLL